jgi:hypothetical protein
VYLKALSIKGLKMFGVKGKLSPHYIGAFSILERCGIVAYKLKLPPSLARVHDIFHVSAEEVLEGTRGRGIVRSGTARGRFDIYLEHPIKILDQKNRVTRRKMIKFFKIQWSNHTVKEAT